MVCYSSPVLKFADKDRAARRMKWVKVPQLRRLRDCVFIARDDDASSISRGC